MVPPLSWTATPSEIGPFSNNPAPSGLVYASMIAVTKPFDPAISSPTGDFWFNSIEASYSGFTPITVAPGESSIVNLVLTPTGSSGETIVGTLYIDGYVSYISNLSPGQNTANELVAVPYTYTVK
jgi:hypothetical protein